MSERKVTTIRLLPELDDKLTKEARQAGISKNSQMIVILNDYFKKASN